MFSRAEAVMSQIYVEAFKLLKLGEKESVDRGFDLLRKEVEARPSDMKALFEYAGAFDFMGQEAQALPHYEKVLEVGYDSLPQEDQPRLFVQLGSTLRNLKRFSESRDALLKGLEHFPGYLIWLVENPENSKWRARVEEFRTACSPVRAA
jgi:tetratricopeptide (TPR) repeat protein